MPRLFVFGTLMTPELLEVVLGRNIGPADLLPAEAMHFRRHALLQDSSYAVLRQEFGSVVSGKAIEVTAEELRRTDFYEHEMYGRRSIEIRMRGKILNAFAYLDDETAPVFEDDWNEEAFQRVTKKSLQKAKKLMDDFR